MPARVIARNAVNNGNCPNNDSLVSHAASASSYRSSSKYTVPSVAWTPAKFGSSSSVACACASASALCASDRVSSSSRARVAAARARGKASSAPTPTDPKAAITVASPACGAAYSGSRSIACW